MGEVVTVQGCRVRLDIVAKILLTLQFYFIVFHLPLFCGQLEQESPLAGLVQPHSASDAAELGSERKDGGSRLCNDILIM